MRREAFQPFFDLTHWPQLPAAAKMSERSAYVGPHGGGRHLEGFGGLQVRPAAGVHKHTAWNCAGDNVVSAPTRPGSISGIALEDDHRRNPCFRARAFDRPTRNKYPVGCSIRMTRSRCSQAYANASARASGTASRARQPANARRSLGSVRITNCSNSPSSAMCSQSQLRRTQSRVTHTSGMIGPCRAGATKTPHVKDRSRTGGTRRGCARRGRRTRRRRRWLQLGSPRRGLHRHTPGSRRCHPPRRPSSRTRQ